MQQTDKTELFEQTPIPTAVRTLMLPTVLSSLVTILYSLADTYFVGLLGNAVQNSAVTLAAPAMLLFNAVNNLFGVGSSSTMSRALGRKDFDTVRRAASFGLYGALGCGLLFSLLCTIWFQPVLRLLGTDASTLEATAAYMRYTVLLGAAPSILNVVLAYLVRAEGASLHASIGTMCGCLLNLLLDPIFILPWGLNMGAAGAGFATLISNCVACCYFVVLLTVRRSRTYIRLHPRYFRPDRGLVLGIFGVGVPAAIQNLLNVTGMTILNQFTAGYGPDAVAAIGISQKIYMVPVQVALGGTQGVMPLIGYSYAARNGKRFRGTIGFVLRLLLPAMVVIGLGCFGLAPFLIRLFIKSDAIVGFGTAFLRAQALAIPFLVADFLVVGVVQGIGKGRYALLFALLRKLALEIPATVLLNTWVGVSGLAFGALIAEVVLSAVGSVLLWRLIRQSRSWNSPIVN